MNIICRITLTLLVFYTFSLNISAQSVGDYRSIQSGDWSNVNTWQIYSNSGWINASSSPSNSDGVITIQNGHTVTVTDTRIADQVVVANGGTLSISGTLSVADGTGNDLEVNGTLNISGNLKDTGQVVINGTATWTSGKMDEAGTTTISYGATLTINGSGKKYLYSNRTLSNSGTVNWIGGNIGCYISTITNNNNANFNIQSDAYIENDSGTSTFENNGVVTKSTTGFTIIYINFNNNSTGSVIANSGTIRFDGNGTHACNFTAASGAVIGFNAGTYTITMSSSSTIIGAGKFQISGATVTISETGTYFLTTTEVTGGTATLKRDITPTNLTVSGRTLGGSGNISVSSTFT